MAIQWACRNNNGTHDFRQAFNVSDTGVLAPDGFFCTKCLILVGGREDFQTDTLTIPES